MDIALLKHISFSKLIILMIEKSLPYIIMIYNSVHKGNLQSVKPVVHADTDAHVYMEKRFYEHLKRLHGVKNSFSIAFIVRDAINLFLWGLEKYSWDDFCKWLEENVRLAGRTEVKSSSANGSMDRHISSKIAKKRVMTAQNHINQRE